MDDYAVSCLRIETLSNAAQAIRECLICRICLEFFQNPVTIKCGHRFCRNCILIVAGNEQAVCPFCNKKIQKRSIPRKECETVKFCVEKFKELVEAIQSDSGIEVLQSLNKGKHTKESICANEKSSLKVDGSIHSQGSSLVTNKKSFKSKIFCQGKKKLSLKKKEDNTLDRYLSSRLNNSPLEVIHADEKVKCWLKTVTSDGENTEIANVNPEKQLAITKDLSKNPNPERASSLMINENTGDHLSSNHHNTTEFTEPSIDVSCGTSNTNNDSKFKDIKMRLHKAEIMAKKQKSSQSFGIAKSSSSIPSVSHSDAYDWRRVKKVGKEMQIKTFKSLNVSIEKVVPLSALNDTVPYDSTVDDSKNISCGSDAKHLSGNNISNRKINLKSSICNSDKFQKQNTNNVIQEYSCNNQSIESLDNYQKEDTIPINQMNRKQVNDIIGIVSTSDNYQPLDKLRNVSDTLNQENLSKTNNLTKFENKSEVNHYNNKFNRKESINDNREAGTYDNQDSPKNKLSLKMRLLNSKSAQSQAYTTDKTSQREIKSSPEKLKSKLLLQLPSSKSCEFYSKDAEKNYSHTNKSSTSYKLIEFKKLGRICKKRKNVPFLHLGRIRSKEKSIICSMDHQQLTKPKIKSSVPINMLYKSKYNQRINETTRTDIPMEVDETLPRITDILKREANNKMNNEINSTMIEEHETKLHIAQTAINESNSIVKKTDYGSLERPRKSTSKLEMEKENPNSNIKNFNSINIIKKKIPLDVISLSSQSSEFNNYQKINDEQDNINPSEKEPSESDNESSIACSIVKKQKCSERKKLTSMSNTSSTPINCLLKKKRTHSESSNEEDDDVSSIIGKWCNTVEEKVTKKPKIVPSSERNFIHNNSTKSKIKQSIFISSEEEDNKLSNDIESLERRKLEKDPPIDDIISKVKSYKQSETSSSKLTDIPSSLLSADLFETNEHGIQSGGNKQLSELISDRTSLGAWNPEKKSNRNSNVSQDLEVTVIDTLQFKKKNVTITSKSLDGFDKENDLYSHSSKNSEKIRNSEQENEISQHEKSKVTKIIPVNDIYAVHDSLLDITQEQIGLKKLEKDLLGVDLSAVINDKGGVQQIENLTTPRRKIANSDLLKSDAEYDSDNIDATPIVKKRKSKRFLPPSQYSSNSDASNFCSPERDKNIIPAYTPVRNTKSYPLCHSTPMINTLSPKKVPHQHGKKIVLVCSSLSIDGIKVVQEFTNRFGATFQDKFNLDVTHVIVETDPDTNIGKKTFKYIQGIAFKKFVINYDWIIDCLNENKLLDEDDTKYEVLDQDTLESGSKKARSQIVHLFKDFAFICQEPFQSLPVKEFNSVLFYCGAKLVSSLEELSSVEEKFKVVIFETENLTSDELMTLKKSGFALVFFEWIVDSISQYQIVSLASYLYDITVEEMRLLGFSSNLLIEDDTIDEQDE